MEMMYYPLGRSSCTESLKVLEADIQHANSLAAAIPRGKGGSHLQMKLVYSQLAPLIFFLLQWIDCSCTSLLPNYLNLFQVLVYKVRRNGKPKISGHGRKATINDFYAVILPSLQRLHNDLELTSIKDEKPELGIISKKKLEAETSFSNVDLEREDECGICLVPCAKIVLPNCCHSMCINCYHDWKTRSDSCPFCRGSIKRVRSRDLWVLTSGNDVIDSDTVSKEELLRFYLYINRLPKDIPDGLFFMYYEYLF